MARRKRARRTNSPAAKSGKRPKSAPRNRVKAGGQRRKTMASSRRKAAPARKAKVSARKTVKSARKSVSAATSVKRPQLDRVRRTLDEVLPTPPSSLDLEQRGSAARSGRAEFENNRRKLGRVMSAGLTGGDVDADFENAYFSGDEAPGGDNPTPDQEVVDDIGKALGVEYNDNEELKSSDKVIERDRHRWELDPASSEDYKDRD